MKKILVLLLCFNIVLAPTYAFANSPLGGWTITDQIAQGASTVITATKTTIINGASVVKTSTAKITPNASQVAKVLRGGLAGYALSVALEQLLGAVDWVLDAENNRIIYGGSPTGFIYTIVSYGGNLNVSSPDYTSACEKAMAAFIKIQSTGGDTFTTSNMYATPKLCTFDYHIKQYTYSERLTVTQIEVDQEPKSLPLEVVAAQVISNAESHADQQKKAGAQAATTAAAQDMLANDSATQSDVETQLNSNAKTQTSEAAQAEATPKDPAAPQAGTDIKITFPVFCSWAPIVCEAAQSAIKFPTTVENWWNTATQAISSSWLYFKEWLDWTKNDSELPDNQTNEVTELPIPELQENAISWSASCPPDVQVPINLYGQSSTLTFSWSPWCQLLNIIKPAIIASAYIGAAFIVLGLRT